MKKKNFDWKRVVDGDELEPGEKPKQNYFMEFAQDHPKLFVLLAVAGILMWAKYGGDMIIGVIKWFFQ